MTFKVDTFAACAARYPDQIVCVGGCSSCCRGLFDITLPDAVLLRSGFDLLPEAIRVVIAGKATSRLNEVRMLWPEFSPPYLLNHRPEEEWPLIMPEEDGAPCLLLDDAGLCLLYEYRPLTCRLHGLPLVDLSGEVMDDSFCPLNFSAQEPRSVVGLRSEFAELFRKETVLIAQCTAHLTGVATAEMDTLIPAALLVDWVRRSPLYSLAPNVQFNAKVP
jgi:Fe-S-cluster containining protein